MDRTSIGYIAAPLVSAKRKVRDAARSAGNFIAAGACDTQDQIANAVEGSRSDFAEFSKRLNSATKKFLSMTDAISSSFVDDSRRLLSRASKKASNMKIANRVGISAKRAGTWASKNPHIVVGGAAVAFFVIRQLRRRKAKAAVASNAAATSQTDSNAAANADASDHTFQPVVS